MATDFPGSKNTFSGTRGAAADKLNAPNHVTHHTNEDDTSEAIQDKLGTGASTPTDTKLLRGTGVGTSAWDKTAPSGTIVGTTDTQTMTNKTLTSPAINSPNINLANNDALTSRNQADDEDKDLVKLNTANLLVLSQLRHQNEDANSITSSTEENVLEQSGWIQIEVTGTPVNAEQEVTFSTAFDTILSVHLTMGGFKGTVMANVTAMTGDTGKAIPSMSALSTSAVTIKIQNGGGSNMVNGFYQVHWIAKGNKA